MNALVRAGTRHWPGASLLAALVVAWQLASGPLVPAMWVSDPLRIAGRLVEWMADGSLAGHVGTTLATMAMGYGAGAVVGIAAGFALAAMPRLHAAVRPVIDGLFCLPKIALLPLLVVLLGVDVASKVVLVASVVVFLAMAATIDGVRHVEPALIDTLAVMGASRSELLWKLSAPAARPWIYVGLRNAVSYAFTTTIVGELLSSNRGLGFLIESSAARFDATGVFAAVVVVVVFSVAMTEGLMAIERRGTRGR